MNDMLLIEARPAGRLGTLNRALNIIEGATLIGQLSRNGQNRKRRYSEAALQKIAAMAEGLPGYLNHVKPEDAFKARDVKDLAVRHRNVHFDPTTQTVKCDMHIADHHAPLVFALAERFGDHIGNSLVSRGVVRMEGDTEVVEDIVQLRSADLVSDPASTKGLFEGKGNTEYPVTLADLVEHVKQISKGDPHTRLMKAVAGARPVFEMTLTEAQLRAAYARIRGEEPVALPADAHARLIAAFTR
jgi:hypothetical protein